MSSNPVTANTQNQNAMNASQALGGQSNDRIQLNNRAREIDQQRAEQARLAEEARRKVLAEQVRKSRVIQNGKTVTSAAQVTEDRIYGLVQAVDKAKTPEEKNVLLKQINDLALGYLEYKKGEGSTTIKRNTPKGVERVSMSVLNAVWGEGFDTKAEADQLSKIIESAYNASARRIARQNRGSPDISTVAGRLDYEAKYGQDPANIKVIDKSGRETSLSNTGMEVDDAKKAFDQYMTNQEQSKEAQNKSEWQTIFESYKRAKEEANTKGEQVYGAVGVNISDTGNVSIKYRTTNTNTLDTFRKQQEQAGVPSGEYKYDEPNLNLKFGSQRIGDILNQQFQKKLTAGEIVKGQDGKYYERSTSTQWIVGDKTFTNPFEASTYSAQLAEKTRQDFLNEKDREMANLGYRRASIDEKTGQITYEPIPGQKQYEYRSDPTNPFKVEKIEVNSPVTVDVAGGTKVLPSFEPVVKKPFNPNLAEQVYRATIGYGGEFVSGTLDLLALGIGKDNSRNRIVSEGLEGASGFVKENTSLNALAKFYEGLGNVTGVKQYNYQAIDTRKQAEGEVPVFSIVDVPIGLVAKGVGYETGGVEGFREQTSSRPLETAIVTGIDFITLGGVGAVRKAGGAVGKVLDSSTKLRLITAREALEGASGVTKNDLERFMLRRQIEQMRSEYSIYRYYPNYEKINELRPIAREFERVPVTKDVVPSDLVKVTKEYERAPTNRFEVQERPAIVGQKEALPIEKELEFVRLNPEKPAGLRPTFKSDIVDVFKTQGAPIKLPSTQNLPTLNEITKSPEELWGTEKEANLGTVARAEQAANQQKELANFIRNTKDKDFINKSPIGLWGTEREARLGEIARAEQAANQQKEFVNFIRNTKDKDFISKSPEELWGTEKEANLANVARAEKSAVKEFPKNKAVESILSIKPDLSESVSVKSVYRTVVDNKLQEVRKVKPGDVIVRRPAKGFGGTTRKGGGDMPGGFTSEVRGAPDKSSLLLMKQKTKSDIVKDVEKVLPSPEGVPPNVETPASKSPVKKTSSSKTGIVGGVVVLGLYGATGVERKKKKKMDYENIVPGQPIIEDNIMIEDMDIINDVAPAEFKSPKLKQRNKTSVTERLKDTTSRMEKTMIKTMQDSMIKMATIPDIKRDQEPKSKTDQTTTPIESYKFNLDSQVILEGASIPDNPFIPFDVPALIPRKVPDIVRRPPEPLLPPPSKKESKRRRKNSHTKKDGLIFGLLPVESLFASSDPNSPRAVGSFEGLKPKDFSSEQGRLYGFKKDKKGARS